jgi:hypothetical protein
LIGDGRLRAAQNVEESSGNMSTPRAQIVYCEAAKALLHEFGEAVQAVLRLHEQQFEAIVDGDSDAARFDLLIHGAVEKKQDAKYAYLYHVDAHCCSSLTR